MKHRLFSSIFDFNNDGELDDKEKFFEFIAFQEYKKESQSLYNYDDNPRLDDDDFDDE